MSRSTALPAGGGRRADLRLLLRGERLARLAADTRLAHGRPLRSGNG